jgi:pilus assembly protein CpaE
MLACALDQGTRQALRDFAAADGRSNATIVEGGIGAAIALLADGATPDLLIIDIGDAEDPITRLGALAEVCPPEATVVAIGDKNDLALYRDLIEMGLTDYLTKPITAAQLHKSLRREQRAAAAPIPRHAADLVVLIGARGGVGTTTLAAGLGWCLAHEQQRGAVLVDFDLHFGNLALSLDLMPGPGLRDALEHPSRIDRGLLDNAMLSESPRLRVLAAEEPLLEHPLIAPGAAEALLAALGAEYEFVIADVPRSFEDATRRLIAAANTVAIVTDLSLSAARDTLRLKEAIKALAPAAKLMLIANQVGAHHRGEVARGEFERVIGLGIDHVIPFEMAAALTLASTGRALPAALRQSKAAAAMRAIAADLCGTEAPTRRKLLPGLRSWMRRPA